ncbi:MAG: hypothetical protein HKM89_06185 [Gemmatimonadales bacterium]|nr:hypothetical protein [Gemmatimonadales bacterium]
MLSNSFFVVLSSALVGRMPDADEFFIAVGFGDSGWDSGLPPYERATSGLVDEVARKAVVRERISFLDENGEETATPTPRLRFRVVFTAGEASGTLRECGLFGGDASHVPDSGTLLSYHTHASIEKTPDLVLERTIRIDLTPRSIVAGTRVTRYLANTHTTELHDLDNETANCQIDEIRVDRRFYFRNIGEATAAGYDFCAYCFGSELSER